VGSEDCLTLNVFSPRHATRLPVMVFIHGGYQNWNSSSLVKANGVRLWDGQHLAEEQKVVVVTLNYRLGPFGFFSHPALTAEPKRGTPDYRASGNYGYMDQLAALTWVRDNISAFGGDEARVMLFGQSAGGASVLALTASSLSVGLYSAALAESPWWPTRPLALGESYGVRLASAAGCPGAAGTDCLRGLPADRLLTALPAAFEAGGHFFRPVVDGYVMPAPVVALYAAGRQRRDVALVVGGNADDNSTLVQYFLAHPIAGDADCAPAVLPQEPAGGFGYCDALAWYYDSLTWARAIRAQYPVARFGSAKAAFIAATTDGDLLCPTRRFMRATRPTHGALLSRYVWGHVFHGGGLLGALGAGHGLELPYVFGNFPDAGRAPGEQPDPSERALSRKVGSLWAGLARGESVFPDYSSRRDNDLRIDEGTREEAGFHSADCDFWDGMSLPGSSE
jgi:para-nitrobenzyl esterase